MDGFHAFTLLQGTHANMPFQCWELRPQGQDSVTLTIAAALTELSISVQASSTLSVPNVDLMVQSVPKLLTPVKIIIGITIGGRGGSQKYNNNYTSVLQKGFALLFPHKYFPNKIGRWLSRQSMCKKVFKLSIQSHPCSFFFYNSTSNTFEVGVSFLGKPCECLPFTLVFSLWVCWEGKWCCKPLVSFQGNQCMLQMDAPGLNHILGRWMSLPALQTAMRRAGVSVFLNEYSDKYVTANAKVITPTRLPSHVHLNACSPVAKIPLFSRTRWWSTQRTSRWPWRPQPLLFLGVSGTLNADRSISCFRYRAHTHPHPHQWLSEHQHCQLISEESR